MSVTSYYPFKSESIFTAFVYFQYKIGLVGVEHDWKMNVCQRLLSHMLEEVPILLHGLFMGCEVVK